MRESVIPWDKVSSRKRGKRNRGLKVFVPHKLFRTDHMSIKDCRMSIKDYHLETIIEIEVNHLKY